MVQDYRPDLGIPNLVYIGLPNKKSLLRTIRKIKAHAVPHSIWEEPDWNMGLSAVATAPISGSIRDIFYEYNTLRFKFGRGPAKAACEGNLDSATTQPDTSNGVCLQ